jgi:catechol 2,3-dioxygenase-like lactoylglutathione lyase family enzyme
MSSAFESRAQGVPERRCDAACPGYQYEVRRGFPPCSSSSLFEPARCRKSGESEPWELRLPGVLAPVLGKGSVDPTDEYLEVASVAHAIRFDHVGITVADLDVVTTFFVTLGLAVEGTRTVVEGAFLETVIGIPGSRTEIVMLRPPEGGTMLELSSFVRPDHLPGSPAPMANELGLRNVAFQVDNLRTAVERLAVDGYGLIGGIGEYEDTWRMAYVRGPEGIIVSLAERIGAQVT